MYQKYIRFLQILKKIISYAHWKTISEFNILLIWFNLRVKEQSDARVQIDEAQYTHYDTQPDKGIPGTCITAKCTQYGDSFW